MSRIIGNIVMIIMIMFAAWFIVSYIDIVLHNLDNPPIYKSWNLIIKLVEWRA
jgi:hypothetical protein